ncbi:MFS general substrate transporter [Mycena latifolia]|nr:MFS general substrate transporter [Mycena latifolia]
METERTPLIPNATPAEPTRQDFALLMIGIWSLTFISSLDTTIVATLLSTIGSSLESMQLSSWIGTAYLLSLCACTPLYGRLANIIGRRPSILFAGTVFGVGTILCGFARNMSQLIVFRALAGVGGSGMTVLGSVIMSDSVTFRSRGLYQGYTNFVFNFGSAIGSPLGGWLGDTIGWRAAFLYQSPFLIFGLLLLYLKVQEPTLVLEATSGNISAKLKRIDYAGSASLAVALLAFLVGMDLKTTAGYEWQDPRVWGFLTASVIFASSFIAIELKFAVEPVMPMSMLKRRTPAFGVLTNFLLAVLNFSTLYNAPLYFTAARLRTATEAGVHLSPRAACVAIGSLLAGWYIRKTGRYWWLLTIGCLFLLGASLALTSWNADTPEWMLYTTLITSGSGMAATSTTIMLALIVSVPRDDIALVTGLSYLFRTMGQVLGVSLSAALTQTLLARNLRVQIVGPGAADTIAKILASTEYIHTLPAELQQKAAASWMGALRILFRCQLVLSVALFLSVLPIEEQPLSDTVGGTAVKRTTPDAAAVGTSDRTAGALGPS